MGKEGPSNPGKVGGWVEKQNPSSSSQDICSVPPCRRLATVQSSGYCSSGFSLQFDF